MGYESAVQQVSERLQKDVYMQANRISLVKAEPDRAVLTMEITETVLNGFGCIHGGAMFGLADTTAGAAAFTDGRRYVTQSGNFAFIGNVSSGTVTAKGQVIHRGRTVTIVEVEVFSETGKLLGHGTYDMFAVNRPFQNVAE